MNDSMGARDQLARPSRNEEPRNEEPRTDALRTDDLRTDDRGVYVVEAALMIPAMLLLAMLLTWAISIGMNGIGLGETARNAARAIARGEDPEAVLERAQSERPDAEVTMQDLGGDVMVELIQDVRVPLLGFTGFGLTLDQSAISVRESAGGAG